MAKDNWFFYGLSHMLQFSELVWALSYSVWDVFNNFILIDATDRSKIISYQKRFFIALSLYPISFFANTPFNWNWVYSDSITWYRQSLKRPRLVSIPLFNSLYFTRIRTLIQSWSGPGAHTPNFNFTGRRGLNPIRGGFPTVNTFLRGGTTHIAPLCKHPWSWYKCRI